MKRISLSIFITFLISLFFSSCSPKSEYEKLVAKELASGLNQDTTLLGIYFGMNRKEFYSHCWNLNKKGLIRQGSENMTIVYELPQMRSMAVLDFFPEFKGDTIYEVTGTIEYLAWAPWNKSLHVDSLMVDVLSLYRRWYGNDFLQVSHPEGGDLYVDIDGNRRIILSKAKNKSVKVTYSNLLSQ